MPVEQPITVPMRTFSDKKHAYVLPRSLSNKPVKRDLFCGQYLLIVFFVVCLITFSTWLSIQLSRRYNFRHQLLQQTGIGTYALPCANHVLCFPCPIITRVLSNTIATTILMKREGTRGKNTITDNAWCAQVSHSTGAGFTKPCALLKLDFLTSAYQNCMRYSESQALSKAQGLHESGPRTVCFDVEYRCSVFVYRIVIRV